jgi:hypothetical protein
MGTQIASLAVVPSVLDFGTVRAGTDIKRHLRISESAHDRFAIKSIDTGNIPLEYSMSTRQNAEGLRDYILNFTLSQKDDSTPENARLVTVHTDSHLNPEVKVPIAYRVLADLQVSPQVIAFGTFSVKASSERTIKLMGGQIRDGCKVRFANLPEGITPMVRSMANGTCEIGVSLIAASVGPAHGSFSIVLDSPAGRQTFPVEFSGYGVINSERDSPL